MKRVITIAGSDSGGGAGIQADIKTITLLGAYASSAVTALTAQNTRAVESIHSVPPDFVAKQIDVVLSDIGTDAAKTGMLHTSPIIEAVASVLRRFSVPNLVVDPVMFSKSGHALLEDDAIQSLVDRLFPLAALVTPNAPEAARILGHEINTVDGVEAAARDMVRRGFARAVVIKGGHIGQDATDVFFDGKELLRIEGDRIQTTSTHGTGCTFSSAIATFLALGHPLPDAVAQAKVFIGKAISFAEPIGSGYGPTNHYVAALENALKAELLASLQHALRNLQDARIGHLIPEVQSNLAAVPPWGTSLDEVAAFPGRIIQFRDTVRTLEFPGFGASSHMGRALLAAKRRDPHVRAVMNIRFSDAAIRAAQALRLDIASFDRNNEPEAAGDAENSTLDWAVDHVFKKTGRIPDVIFDRGAVGKEPMIRIFGRTPLDVAHKVILIRKELEEQLR